jgi:hypothetical protein
MEFSIRDLVQFGAIAISVIGGIVGARMTIKQLVSKVEALEDVNKQQDMRLDTSESTDAVMESKLKVLTEINSVSNLEKRNTQFAEISATVRMMEKEIDLLRKQHNGTHPPVRSLGD